MIKSPIRGPLFMSTSSHYLCFRLQSSISMFLNVLSGNNVSASPRATLYACLASKLNIFKARWKNWMIIKLNEGARLWRLVLFHHEEREKRDAYAKRERQYLQTQGWDFSCQRRGFFPSNSRGLLTSQLSGQTNMKGGDEPQDCDRLFSYSTYEGIGIDDDKTKPCFWQDYLRDCM